VQAGSRRISASPELDLLYPVPGRNRALNLQDLDASAASFFRFRLGIDDTTVSQEFLLNSKAGIKAAVDYGTNYFRTATPGVFDASFGAAPFAVFGGSNTLTNPMRASWT